MSEQEQTEDSEIANKCLNCGKTAVCTAQSRPAREDVPPIPLVVLTCCLKCYIWGRYESEAPLAIMAEEIESLRPWMAFYYGMFAKRAAREHRLAADLAKAMGEAVEQIRAMATAAQKPAAEEPAAGETTP